MFNFAQPGTNQGTSSFGAVASQNNALQGASQFGGATTQPNTSQAAPLFASSSQPMSGGLFGQQPATQMSQFNPSTPFGGSFGVSAPSNFSALPSIAQPVTGIPYPKDTKFIDLPNETKSSLEAVEKIMQQYFEQSNILSSKNYMETVKLTADISHFEARLVAAESATETCRGQLTSAKRVMNQFWKYGEGSARMIMSSKQQNVADGSIKWVPVISPSDLTLFEEMTARVESQVAELAESASNLSRQLEYSSSSVTSPIDSLRGSIKNLHAFFVAVSSKIALLQDEVDQVKRSYRHFLSRFRNDARDPFATRNPVTTAPVSNPNANPAPAPLQNPAAVPQPQNTASSTLGMPSFTSSLGKNPSSTAVTSFAFPAKPTAGLQFPSQPTNQFLQTPK